MALEVPIWIEATGGDTPILLSAQQYRTLIDALYSSEGVCGLTDLVVTQRAAGANMSVDVSAGEVIITGDAVANQGKYVCRSTAITNLAIATAPGSGSRTDLVVAQLYDKQADGGTQYAWTPLVVTGSTTPPASSVVLARVTVPSGTASITTASNISITGSPARQFAQIRQSSYRPVYTLMVTSPPLNNTSVNDFSGAAWPALTTTFPPSGILAVTISAGIGTNNASTIVWANWRISSGSGTIVNQGGLSTGDQRMYASRRTIVTGTPGTSITFTPTWQNTAGAIGAGTTFVDGMLLAEPVF